MVWDQSEEHCKGWQRHSGGWKWREDEESQWREKAVRVLAFKVAIFDIGQKGISYLLHYQMW